ncbi:MAG: response regulator [Sedimentisphaerales bacterium]|nr:response regulator [Sedimentisphaerales bacterium]
MSSSPNLNLNLKAKPKPQPLGGEPIQILLIEDNPGHAELVIRTLEHHRIANQIVTLPDGQAALDYLFGRAPYDQPASATRPHVILLDLRLPKIDGLEVLREIKNDPVLRRIPVVILTTSKAEQDVARAYEYHANSYLVKPVDFTKFSQMMQDLGFYWLGWNCSPWA